MSLVGCVRPQDDLSLPAGAGEPDGRLRGLRREDLRGDKSPRWPFWFACSYKPGRPSLGKGMLLLLLKQNRGRGKGVKFFIWLLLSTHDFILIVLKHRDYKWVWIWDPLGGIFRGKWVVHGEPDTKGLVKSWSGYKEGCRCGRFPDSSYNTIGIDLEKSSKFFAGQWYQYYFVLWLHFALIYMLFCSPRHSLSSPFPGSLPPAPAMPDNLLTPSMSHLDTSSFCLLVFYLKMLCHAISTLIAREARVRLHLKCTFTIKSFLILTGRMEIRPLLAQHSSWCSAPPKSQKPVTMSVHLMESVHLDRKWLFSFL